MHNPADDGPIRLREGIGQHREWARWVLSRPVLSLAILAAVLYRVGFWIAATPTFEDALISFTHVRSAAEGLGLTHHAGEPPVHGFTSAASVLIPLIGELVAAGSGLILLRIVSLLVAVATIVFAWKICLRLEIGRWPSALALGVLATERHHVFFGVAGMETQLAVAALLGSILAVLERRHWLVGLSLGLAFLVRPDYAVWGVIAVTAVAFRGWMPLIKAIGPATLIVAPWVGFTTLYYGSPIPHTVVAKSAAYLPPVTLETWWPWLEQQVTDHAQGIVLTFAPFYSDSGVVDALIPKPLAASISITILTLAAIGAVATWRVAEWRPVTIFAAAYLVYRMLLLPTSYFEWYLPPFTAVVILLAAGGLQASVASWRPIGRTVPFVVGGILIAFALHIPLEASLEGAQRARQAKPVRQQVGEYLANHVAPGEVVSTEPAGYIGFYSRALLYDYPGLTSKAALTAFESLPAHDRSLAAFINKVQPEWLALRGWELEDLMDRFPDTAGRYAVRGTFNEVGVEWEPGEPIPTRRVFGLEVRAFSAHFDVLQRSD